MNPTPLIEIPNRRTFLKSTSAVAGATLVSSVSFPNVLRGAQNGAKLKIGMIGCGGRCSGAADEALGADSNSELWSVAEVSAEAADRSLSTLTNKYKERVNVAPERKFIGIDAYKQMLASGVDVVLIATPPGFRPAHLAAAVEAGKHIFCEKPMAVDATGVRSVMESVKKSKEKGINLVAGFCWRYCTSRREIFQAVHDGAIGDITSYYGTYYTGPVKPMPAASTRQPGWSDIEWQVRNWYNFSWLSGDGYVEQCVHTVDKMAWVFRDKPPISAVATGGRQNPAEGGNIFDHMTVVYEYEGGVMGTIGQRQIPNCFNENADYIRGTKGVATIGVGAGPTIRGEKNMRFKTDHDDMYQQEHNEFFAAIRSGNIINDGDRMASSTLLGIMGRMAAYTGKKITWEQALNSKEDLAPEETFKWDSKFDPMDRPIPGKYPLI